MLEFSAPFAEHYHSPWRYEGGDYWNQQSNFETLVEDVSDVTSALADFTVVRATRKVTSSISRFAVAQISPSRVRWLRVGGKIGGRFLPIVGWGLLAYDLYNLGEDLDLY